MRGMILAAGRGKRMGKLTDHTPKPLLSFQGKFLIEHAISLMKHAGIREIMINVSWQAQQISQALGDGRRHGVTLSYSHEPEVLETGGGIVNVLPFFQDRRFLVMSADIVADPLPDTFFDKKESLAHLLLVRDHAGRCGDFSLSGERVQPPGKHVLLYANIGLFYPAFFADCAPVFFRLGDLLRKRVAEGRVTGELWRGKWHNIGTPSQLEE